MKRSCAIGSCRVSGQEPLLVSQGVSIQGNLGLRRICAWCQKPLDDKPGDGSPITHGICEVCAEQVLTTRTATNDFVNTIESPVLVVDGNVRVIATNNPAL